MYNKQGIMVKQKRIPYKIKAISGYRVSNKYAILPKGNKAYQCTHERDFMI